MARGRTILSVAVLVLVVANFAGTLNAAPTASEAPWEPPVVEAEPVTPGSSLRDLSAAATNSVVALAPPQVPTDTQGALSSFAEAPAASAPSFGPVQTARPALRVQVGDPTVAEAIRQVAGVATAAAIEVGQVPVQAGQEVRSVTVAAVVPEAFRPLTPDVTAAEPQVWERIAAGDAAFTFDAASYIDEALGRSSLGQTVAAGRLSDLRIGVHASNGIPPVADALVSVETARELGLEGTTEIYLAVTDGADLDAVRAAVEQIAGVQAEVLEVPVQQQAFLQGNDAQVFFEPFNYIDHGDGMITIDPAWVERNVVRARVPILTGEVVCHRQYVIQLTGALQELVDLGLSHLIDPTQYGGCWVPRHIDWRADRPLSMHSWGLAADFNVSTNGLGQVPQMDLRVVEVFDRWGFVWGGRWSRPDGMHFELAAVLQPGS